jgi:two-component system phosphate regulon sensor histidine kinase PhoR
MRRPSPVRQVFAWTYVLVLTIVVAACALAYYGYEYAHDIAHRGEESIIGATRDVAQEKVASIENKILENDQNLFNLVELEDLKELPRRWKQISPTLPTISSVVVLDEHLSIAPDGFVSKKRPPEAVAFRSLFEKQILADLDLGTMGPDEQRHLHKQYDDRYYALSTMRRDVDGRRFYVVIDEDLGYLVGEEFPADFADFGTRRLYQIVDERGDRVFGHSADFSRIPARYTVTEPFRTTLTAWQLRIAPRDVPTLVAKAATRRASDWIFIGLSAGTLFVGLGILTFAMRTERRANQLKSDFIANVSHELKTPLSLIRMFGELLATGRTKSPENAREYAEIITRESERLSRLIDNVLDFARIERGKVAYDFKIGDLGEVLSRGLDVYRYRLDREQMKLTVDMPPDLPSVRLDENAMTLVLLNLVDNAVKYASDGKALHVTLTLDAARQRVLLRVADQGPGISPDEQHRIFERFYRSRTVRGRPVRGSGIGLSLVKHIAEAHGGGVFVESTLGKGSTFVVWLPVAPVEPAPEPEPDPSVEPASAAD